MRIAVTGEEGDGKTMFAAIMGSIASMSFQMPLGANMPLYGPEYQFIDSKEKLFNFTKGVLVFDEMWLSVDSRFPQKNVEFTKWVKQTRKKHILMFYTVQSLDQIDKRVKDSTKLLLNCEKLRSGAIRGSFYKFRTLQFIRSFTINDPSQFYSLYDTDYVVDIFDDA